MHKKSFKFILLGILILSGSVLILTQTKSKSPLYYEAKNKEYSLSSFQQRSQTNDDITDSRKTAITETVKKLVRQLLELM